MDNYLGLLLKELIDDINELKSEIAILKAEREPQMHKGITYSICVGEDKKYKYIINIEDIERLDK